MLGENGSKIVDTHFWGGFGSEHTGALAFDKNGDIVVTGRTTSIDMFTTPMVIQPISPGFNSGFLCRYSPSEDRLL
ncbi:MAG: hypothetical protein GWN18_04920, partial [Thermoplasmata archaeon]|nr:hypothetical protein [Thermoplasmata archaeon]NIS11370.1 hypothetical protein [Thermoplasmata archaeon]NIS19308.1 hypothetical protein [Thermoplasmata archaeon]NIT76397.1 hypothetical protein [Thermoplasmata archaeon]NIU48436.1 hypothetical protein [Thermoplasmata archaeon]